MSEAKGKNIKEELSKVELKVLYITHPHKCFYYFSIKEDLVWHILIMWATFLPNYFKIPCCMIQGRHKIGIPSIKCHLHLWGMHPGNVHNASSQCGKYIWQLISKSLSLWQSNSLDMNTTHNIHISVVIHFIFSVKYDLNLNIGT